MAQGRSPFTPHVPRKGLHIRRLYIIIAYFHCWATLPARSNTLFRSSLSFYQSSQALSSTIMSGYAGYDESLLASAPVATKSQLQVWTFKKKIYRLISSSSIFFQSGYSIDLLREKKKPPPRRQNLDGFEPTTPAVVPFRSRPFYRRKRGIIIILIVFIALLAVIIGAVVGSKTKKKSSAKKPISTGTTSAGATGIQTFTSAKPTNLTSRTFTWTITRSGASIPTTTVFPPGIEFTLS